MDRLIQRTNNRSIDISLRTYDLPLMDPVIMLPWAISMFIVVMPSMRVIAILTVITMPPATPAKRALLIFMYLPSHPHLFAGLP
jgi:hypothetical protein